MYIIKKYKKVFITIVIVSAILALIPSLGMLMYVGVSEERSIITNEKIEMIE